MVVAVTAAAAVRFLKAYTRRHSHSQERVHTYTFTHAHTCKSRVYARHNVVRSRTAGIHGRTDGGYGARDAQQSYTRFRAPSPFIGYPAPSWSLSSRARRFFLLLCYHRVSYRLSFVAVNALIYIPSFLHYSPSFVSAFRAQLTLSRSRASSSVPATDPRLRSGKTTR